MRDWTFGDWLGYAGIAIAFVYVNCHVLSKSYPELGKWIETRIEPTDRAKRIYRSILVIGSTVLFIAASVILAVRVNSVSAAAKPEKVINERDYHWTQLSLHEGLEIKKKLIGISPQKIAIYCGFNDCGDLALSFRDLFKDLGWVPEMTSHIFVEPRDGIWLSVHDDDKLWSIALDIEEATAGRLKIGRFPGEFPFRSDYARVALLIGSKP